MGQTRRQVLLHPDPRKVTFSTAPSWDTRTGLFSAQTKYGRPPIKRPEVTRLRDHEWQTFQRAKQSWDTMYGELSPEEKRRALFGPAN